MEALDVARRILKLPPEQQSVALEAFRAAFGADRKPKRRDQETVQAARESLLDFTCYTYPGYEVNWHHRRLCHYLDQFIAKKIKRLMVFMPPRHGKSELVSRRLPAYIFGRNPDAKIIACSYGADLAGMMNRDVQRIIDGQEYAELFPGTKLSGENIRTVAFGHYLRNSDIFEIVGRRGVYRSAGIGGGITGMGCHYGIIDDPIKNAEEADSEVYREKQWEWYTTTFLTRLEKDGCILLTMTRWHEDDLAGRLLKMAKENSESDQWVVVKYPAIAEADRAADDPREEGEALWPGKKSVEELAPIRAISGSYRWSAVFQQSPSPAEGGTIKRDWWVYYDDAPESFDEVLQSWDLTFKDASTSDYVVGQVWARAGSRVYLLDQVRGRMDAPAVIRAILSLSQKWPDATLKLIEDTANGPAVISLLYDKVQGLVPVPAKGSKDARVQAVAPLIEAHNVFLPNPDKYPWVGDFVDECASFPNGAHDDQVDAMAHALNRLRRGVEALWEVKPISITKAEVAERAENPSPPRKSETDKRDPHAPMLVTGKRRSRVGW